jgi:transposase
MAKNSVKAIALGAGLVVRSQFYSQAGRQRLEMLKLTPSVSRQAEELIELIDQLNEKIKRVEEWLTKEAAKDERVTLLQTQHGIGLLTSLALVSTLEPIERFSTSRKVTAYVGMDPVEDSSGERKRIGSISKSGSKLVRFLLCEAAQVAIQKDEELKKFFYRVMKRRNTPKAIVAVGRKLLVRSFIMLRDGIDAEEFARRGVKARSSRVAHRPSTA